MTQIHLTRETYIWRIGQYLSGRKRCTRLVSCCIEKRKGETSFGAIYIHIKYIRRETDDYEKEEASLHYY